MSSASGLAGATVPTREGDRARILELLAALGCRGEAIVLSVAGEPVPKPRARHGQGRTFSTSRQRRAEASLALALRSAFPRPLVGNVALVAIYYRASRRRVDRDNLDKLSSDASNGVAVADDSQITAGAQLVELDREAPRTVLGFAAHRCTLAR